MVLKWLTVEDDEFGHRAVWNYLDGVVESSVQPNFKEVDSPTEKNGALEEDGVVIDAELANSNTRIIFARHSAFLISDKTGQTLDRLI